MVNASIKKKPARRPSLPPLRTEKLPSYVPTGTAYDDDRASEQSKERSVSENDDDDMATTAVETPKAIEMPKAIETPTTIAMPTAVETSTAFQTPTTTIQTSTETTAAIEPANTDDVVASVSQPRRKSEGEDWKVPATKILRKSRPQEPLTRRSTPNWNCLFDAVMLSLLLCLDERRVVGIIQVN